MDTMIMVTEVAEKKADREEEFFRVLELLVHLAHR